MPLIKEAIANGEVFRAQAFELACARNDIDHRTTKPKHPWTNGQVERMNRTIKDATVKRFYYESHDQLRRHLVDFVSAYNFGRRLKTLKGSHPTSSSAKYGLHSRNASLSVRSSKCRDQTSNPRTCVSPPISARRLSPDGYVNHFARGGMPKERIAVKQPASRAFATIRRTGQPRITMEIQ